MIIANPIYDVVFKYLLEDISIAKELLSVILGQEIIELQLKPQETLVTGEGGEVKIFHLDFKALISTGDGQQKTVLIELQKAKKSYDILRFRKYLGNNYAQDEIRKNKYGDFENYALEIVTIYFLGFKLDGVEVPVLKVSRKTEDAITKKEVVAKNDFISHLTHESFMIQIPRLLHHQRNKLEEVLEVFNQENITDNLHRIDFKKLSKNLLVQKIVRRLSKAAADVEVKKIMEAEDMIARLINRANEEKFQETEEKIQELEEKLQASEQERILLMQKIEALSKNNSK